MKTTVLRLICLLSAISPMVAVSQTNIKSAFDEIINCPEVELTERHSLDKDPDTKEKTGQYDIYNFVLPAEKKSLIKNVYRAFDKDIPLSYSVKSGKARNEVGNIYLAVADASSSVYIDEPECDYMYALFLPDESEDPDGKYRYAYAINYQEKEGKIIGKLVVTYATTLKYRQQAMQEKQDILSNKNKVIVSKNGVVEVFTDGAGDSWFGYLMRYLNSMEKAHQRSRISIATKAYQHITDVNKYPNVTEQDKNAAREVLKAMISKPQYSDSVLNALLRNCLNAIN